jgi:hypothetical protein
MRIRYLLCAFLTLVAAGSLGIASDNKGETEYFAVFMEGKKVGHSVETRLAEQTTITTTTKISITITRLNTPITMNIVETCVETADGKPLSFESVQELSAMTVKVAGTIDKSGTVSVTATSMGTEQKSSLQWPEGAVMAEGLRLLNLQKGLKEGSKYIAKIFEPSMMQAIEAQIEVGSKTNVDLLGRVVALTEVTTTMNLPGAGTIATTTYVDDELHVQKTVMPLAGMQVEMVACTKEFALGKNDVLELIEKLFVPSPQPLDDVGSAKSIVYHLVPTQGADLPIPSNDNQKVQRLKDGTILVTVAPADAPQGAKFPYKGTEQAILEATKPTRFLQSDRKEVVDLARGAVGDTRDAAEAARKIESFVARYIDNRSLSVGYASAAEIVVSKQGDCSEFAVLTAAMCRAVGIPAQVATGVAYVKDFGGPNGCFGGHAWVQAYIGGKPGKWVGLDAAFRSAGRGGYGPGHITLAVGNGDPEGFFDLVNTLGQFKISKVTVNRNK